MPFPLLKIWNMNMTPYDILEIKRDASAEDIKRAYKKLALRLHPDKTGGNEEAAETFRKVNDAYAVLGDKERRERYDRFGDEGGSGSAQKGDQGGQGFEDILRGMFNGGGGMGSHPQGFHFVMNPGDNQVQRGRDTINIQIFPRDVYLGCTRNVDFLAPTACTLCSGSGAASPEDIVPCPPCGGTGSVQIPCFMAPMRMQCPACSGKGRSFRVNGPDAPRCLGCSGSGATDCKRTFNVHVPPGISDNTGQLLPGQGGFDSRSRSNRDLELRFTRTLPEGCVVDAQGGGVTLTVPISLADVLCGFNRKVDIFDGADSVHLLAEAYEHPGRVWEFPGKGLPTSCSGNVSRGVLKIVLDVKFPPTASLTRHRDALRDLLHSVQPAENETTG